MRFLRKPKAVVIVPNTTATAVIEEEEGNGQKALEEAIDTVEPVGIIN